MTDFTSDVTEGSLASDSGSVSSEPLEKFSLLQKKQAWKGRKSRGKAANGGKKAKQWGKKQGSKKKKKTWNSKWKKRDGSGKKKQAWKKRSWGNKSWRKNKWDNSRTKTLNLEDLFASRLEDHLPDELQAPGPQKIILTNHQISIRDLLHEIMGKEDDADACTEMCTSVVEFLSPFDTEKLTLTQSRYETGTNVKGSVTSELHYDHQLVWKKDTSFIHKNGPNGSIHDARLLSGKQVLYVQTTHWAWYFEKFGYPYCEHSELRVVDILRQAGVEF